MNSKEEPLLMIICINNITEKLMVWEVMLNTQIKTMIRTNSMIASH